MSLGGRDIDADARHAVIGGVLASVAAGLLPFVSARVRDARLEDAPHLSAEPLVVLTVLWRHWNEIARGWFDPSWKTVRGHVGELIDARHRLAHQGAPWATPFGEGDVERVRDTALRLLTAVSHASLREGRDGAVVRTLSHEESQAITAALREIWDLDQPSEDTGYERARRDARRIQTAREAVQASAAAQKAGDLFPALAYAERGVELERNVYSLNRLASALRSVARLEDAELTARGSVAIDDSPWNAPGLVTLAAILCDKGRPETVSEAITLCRRVIAANPDSIFAKNVLARALALARSGGLDVAGDDPDDEDIPF